MEIRHDLDISHLQTKIKLVYLSILTFQLEDALTKRNMDYDFAEDNNR